MFVKAHDNGNVSCDQNQVSSSSEKYDVVPIRPGVIAIKSISGKYLSGKINQFQII